jgi:hypothetical protein
MKNYTDITAIIDRSGSMSIVQKDMEGGFNTFLEEQKKTPGEATITLVEFDDRYDVVYENRNIRDAPAYSLIPRGMTRLCDAVGKAVSSTGVRLEKLSEDERPNKVLFIIITDGGENDSKEYTKAMVKEMVTHQEEKYSWQFTYLGANQDATAEGTSIGVRSINTITYDQSTEGLNSLYDSLSSATARMKGSTTFSPMGYTPEEKLAVENVVKKKKGRIDLKPDNKPDQATKIDIRPKSIV